MARSVRLGPKAQKQIVGIVEAMFDKLRERFLGAAGKRAGGKQLVFHYQPYTLTSLFESASKQEGLTGRAEVLDSLVNIAGSYIDSQKEHAKGKIVQQVQAFLTDAEAKGVKVDPAVVLGGQLADTMAKVRQNVTRILETETTSVRNMAIHDAIGRIGATLGNDDPTVYFVVVRDNSCCDECLRLHLMPDGSPRLWKLSQVKAGYHKKGEEFPSISGLHPNCRCIMSHLLRGFGFDSAGAVTYIGMDHDEHTKRQG